MSVKERRYNSKTLTITVAVFPVAPMLILRLTKEKEWLGDTMKFNVHKQSSIPIYQQIYEQIRYRIQTGMIKPGDQLPSLRKLSQDLKISL